jgi:hypothetical protein
MSPTGYENLEEIVISGSERPPLGKNVRRRSQERKVLSPRQKNHTADEMPLLQHSASEPSSRLEASILFILAGRTQCQTYLLRENLKG